jgi:hypothetical protein
MQKNIILNMKCYFKAGFNWLNNKSWECNVYNIFPTFRGFVGFAAWQYSLKELFKYYETLWAKFYFNSFAFKNSVSMILELKISCLRARSGFKMHFFSVNFTVQSVKVFKTFFFENRCHKGDQINSKTYYLNNPLSLLSGLAFPKHSPHFHSESLSKESTGNMLPKMQCSHLTALT